MVSMVIKKPILFFCVFAEDDEIAHVKAAIDAIINGCAMRSVSKLKQCMQDSIDELYC